MKNTKEKINWQEMPIGYSIVNQKIVSLGAAKKDVKVLMPVNQLSIEQKKKLVIANWEYECWFDIYMNEKFINLETAIDEVNKNTEIGIELIRLATLGFETMYEGLNSENALMKYDIIKPIKNNVQIREILKSDLSVLIYNQLDSDVSIYKQSASQEWVYVCNAPHDSGRPEGANIDFIGQAFEARLYNGNNYTVVGLYLAYPGNLSWDIVSFDAGAFMPSGWFSPVGNMTIKNNLYTYIELCQVIIDGSLTYVCAIPPNGSTVVGLAYLGTSLIAKQGETVIAEFILKDSSELTWNINPESAPLEAVNFTGMEQLSCQQNFNVSGDFTILCSLSSQAITVNNLGTVLGLTDNSGVNDSVVIETSAQPVGLNIFVGENQFNLPIAFNPNQFYQLCITKSSTGITVYIDGYPSFSQSFTSYPALQNCTLTLGISTMWNCYQGCMKNFGIWNRALSLTEIFQSQLGISGTLLNNLLGFWTLNGTIMDSTNNPNLLLKSLFPAGNPTAISYSPCFNEILISGSNEYMFYQASGPQNDTISSQGILLEKTISVGANVPYVYASFIDVDNVYYSFPQGMVLEITDPNGTTYNQTIIPDDPSATVYAQMSIDNSSLYHLCIKNPVQGNWTVKITGYTNLGFRFQFQTMPTNQPYQTMQQTLESILGNNWDKIALKGFTNVLTGKPFNPSNMGMEAGLGNPLLVAFIVAALVVILATQIKLATQVHTGVADTDGNQHQADRVVRAAAEPPPQVHNILLLDAKGPDEATRITYNYRNRKLYPYIQTGHFRDNNNSIIGTNDTNANVIMALQTTNLVYVSASGHGNYNRLEGYNQIAVLTSDQVIATPALAHGKIFHFLACRTGGGNPNKHGDIGLGSTLVNNGALAFLGYNVEYEVSSTSDGVISGDVMIDTELLDGKTVGVAYNSARQKYQQVINRATNGENPNPTMAGYALNNLNGLVVFGNQNATIFDL